MPTKAQLETTIMEMHSVAEHVRRKHADEVCDLSDTIADLEAQVERLREAIRPQFLPAGSSVQEVTGTAHCPMCEAVAPAVLKFSEMRRCHVIATPRPLIHREDCIFAEEIR